jgi:hypothetical protein
MKLYSNWRDIARKAWSIRLIVLAGVMTGLEALVTFFGVDWIPLPHWLRMVLITLLMGGAFVARLVSQKGIG